MIMYYKISIKRGNTVSRGPNFIFVNRMPEGVATMQGARAGSHKKGVVKEVLKAHIY